MRAFVMIAFVVALARVAQAQAPAPVALLPLDAEQRLEIYGQPVASEIARVLSAAGIDVVIVGPKMAVPARARLVMDGTIKAGKSGAVTLSVRIRDPRDANKVLDTLPATAASLDAIEAAIEELSGRVLPSVKGWLGVLAAQDADKLKASTEHHDPVARPQEMRPIVAAVSINTHATGNVQPFDGALKTAVAAWAQRRHHTAKLVEMKQLAGKTVAPKAVVAANADLGVWLDIQEVQLELGAIPMGRARVRVQVSDASSVVFDRVVFTDTVIGDKNLGPEKLAERVAREILVIAEPHVRRAISRWQ